MSQNYYVQWWAIIPGCESCYHVHVALCLNGRLGLVHSLKHIVHVLALHARAHLPKRASSRCDTVAKIAASPKTQEKGQAWTSHGSWASLQTTHASERMVTA